MKRVKSVARSLARERMRAITQAALCKAAVQRGVSQTELARRLGVSRARVSQMFGRSGNLTAHTIGDVLHALDCSVAEWAVLVAHASFAYDGPKGRGKRDQ